MYRYEGVWVLQVKILSPDSISVTAGVDPGFGKAIEDGGEGGGRKRDYRKNVIVRCWQTTQWMWWYRTEWGGAITLLLFFFLISSAEYVTAQQTASVVWWHHITWMGCYNNLGSVWSLMVVQHGVAVVVPKNTSKEREKTFPFLSFPLPSPPSYSSRLYQGFIRISLEWGNTNTCF